MDEKSKKIGAAVLVGVGIIAGIILLITWLDLILTASTAELLISGVSKHTAGFVKNSSIALIFCVFATAAAIIYGFFSKNTTLRKVILITQALTIAICIVLCAVASVYYGGELMTKGTTFVVLVSFQTSLMRLIATCAVLLTATAVWYGSDFKKARLENESFGLEEEDAL